MSTNLAFAQWASDLQKRLRLSDTEMGARLGITAPGWAKWRTGQTAPSKTEYLDKLVELSGDEPSKVYALAGRGQLGMSAPDLDPEYRELAYAIQEELRAIKDPVIRANAREELLAALNAWRDSRERVNQLLEALLNHKEITR